MKYETIKYEKEDGFVLLTMDRPARLNAMNPRMMEEISDAQREILKDKEVNVFIITGSPRPDGRPCFSAGADLKEDAEGVPRWNYSDQCGPGYLEEDDLFPVNSPGWRLWRMRPRILDPLFLNPAWMPKISIAAVDGVATAGGIEIALACDIILCSETAQITDSHVKNLKIGIGSGSVTTTLTRRVGYSKALELCLLGEFIDGKEAKAIGFANQVYPPDRLIPEAKNMARKIAAMRPTAVQATKLSCRSVNDWNYNQAWAHGDEVLKWLITDPEYVGLQGVTQQWDKRKR